jgi:hypothetical protein
LHKRMTVLHPSLQLRLRRLRSITTNRLVRFIAVGMVLLLAISIGAFYWFRVPATPSQNPADVNAIYQVVGEFGARLRDVDMSAPTQNILAVLNFDIMKKLITDRLYQVFMQDTSRIPGRITSSPWPESIQIVSVRKLDDTSYTVNGSIILMTSNALAQGGNAGLLPITLTLKKTSLRPGKAMSAWLIDDVVGGTQPST